MSAWAQMPLVERAVAVGVAIGVFTVVKIVIGAMNPSAPVPTDAEIISAGALTECAASSSPVTGARARYDCTAGRSLVTFNSADAKDKELRTVTLGPAGGFDLLGQGPNWFLLVSLPKPALEDVHAAEACAGYVRLTHDQETGREVLAAAEPLLAGAAKWGKLGADIIVAGGDYFDIPTNPKFAGEGATVIDECATIPEAAKSVGGYAE